jgi:putative transcriptional regulator
VMSPNKARVYRRRPPTQLERLAQLERKNLNIYRLRQGGSRVRGSRVGDDLVEAFEEMAKHLRGEIELEGHDLPGGALTPAQIKAIRLKIASSTKEFERLFGIPARTMESYEQGRRKLDGAMRALLRIIDREPKAAFRALTR